MRFASSVIHGSKHGRTIGYPTINLAITDKDELKQLIKKDIQNVKEAYDLSRS